MPILTRNIDAGLRAQNGALKTEVKASQHTAPTDAIAAIVKSALESSVRSVQIQEVEQPLTAQIEVIFFRPEELDTSFEVIDAAADIESAATPTATYIAQRKAEALRHVVAVLPIVCTDFSAEFEPPTKHVSEVFQTVDTTPAPQPVCIVAQSNKTPKKTRTTPSTTSATKVVRNVRSAYKQAGPSHLRAWR
jgi:hypothetical protein